MLLTKGFQVAQQRGHRAAYRAPALNLNLLNGHDRGAEDQSHAPSAGDDRAGVRRRRRATSRALQGGVGNLGLPAATSSGQRITCLPSCHCVVTAFWAIWNPRSSIAKSPRIVFVFSLSNVSRSLSESMLPARRAASANSWQPA